MAEKAKAPNSEIQDLLPPSPAEESGNNAVSTEDRSAPEPVVVNSVAVNAPPELTDDQRRIRELEAKLDALLSGNVAPPAAVVDDSKETARQQAIDNGDLIVLHFLESGFTTNGGSWYLGQEVEFDRNSQAYKDTCDRNGKSWTSMSEVEQYDRYGKLYFRPGPWPFKTWESLLEDPSLTDDERKKVQAAIAKEQARGRRVPRVPMR